MARAQPKPISFAEAHARVLAAVSALDAERVPLADARGRVLAESVFAARPHPTRDDSAMDGYAVRLADLRGATREGRVRLRLAPTVAAPGMPAPPLLRAGEAVRILTGGPVPAGADAVVRQEAAALEGADVLFWSEPEPGENIRRAGEDVAAGARVLDAGALLGSGELAALATLGRAEVAVVRRPVCAILTTGDELREPGETLGPGQIYDSNGVGLAAMVRDAGAVPLCLGPVPDDRGALRTALLRAEAADAIVTAAGISVGDRDLIADVLAELGAEWLFRGVRMKPGKPASFGRLRGRPVFGLPGNPAAALVAFEVLARPALLRLAGHEAVERPRELAVLDGAIEKRGGSVYFVRGIARRERGRLRFRPLDRQGVGMITSMIGHNALALFPAERTRFAPGEAVEVALVGDPVPAAGEATAPVPVIAFVGRSGSGKTTLLCELLPLLRARGLRVAALKHDTHGFEMDREGKDTWRLAQAGAASVAIVGPERVGAVLGERAPPLDELVARLFPGADLVLAEGFHEAHCPKVLVLDARGPEPRDAAASELVAVVGGELEGVPAVERSDLGALAGRILETISRS